MQSTFDKLENKYQTYKDSAKLEMGIEEENNRKSYKVWWIVIIVLILVAAL